MTYFRLGGAPADFGAAGWERLRLTLLLAALTAFGALSIDMYLPGLPQLAAGFGASGAGAQLTVSSFLLGFGCGQLIYGPLADRLGRRRPLLAGLTLFTLASIGCAVAPSLGLLVALRFLQALGGCAGPILVRAAVRDLHGKEDGARLLSLLASIMALAPLLAPLVGGQLVIHIGWRAVFWLLTAIGAACLAGTLLGFAESLPSSRRFHGSWATLFLGYGRLLHDRRFVGYALSGALVLGGMFAYITGSPAVFIADYGVEPQYYGLYFGANAAGIMLCAWLNRRLIPRVGVERMLHAGIVLAAVAGSVLALAGATGWGGFPGILVPLFFFVASVGFVSANSVAAGLDLFPRQAGTAAAVIGTMQFAVGAALSALIDLLDNGSALSMCGVIGAAGLAALGVFRALSALPEPAVGAVK
jgi:DHA1 family bicyclomycin/chloramphenicol resistance-like MFS transporter